MNFTKENVCLYLVTDRAWTTNQTLYQQVELALKGGVTCLQLREKELPFDQFLQQATQLATLCKAYKVPFIVNDNLQVALQSHADGIHVGQGDLSPKEIRRYAGDRFIIGVSVHTVEQALTAAQDGADYLGVGAVFSTATKSDAEQVSLSVLQQICSSVNVPVVAIGGIHKDNILQLQSTGVDGVAVVSAILSAREIQQATRQLKALSIQVGKSNAV